jgi:lipopolysaccharide transport system permease protein
MPPPDSSTATVAVAAADGTPSLAPPTGRTGGGGSWLPWRWAPVRLVLSLLAHRQLLRDFVVRDIRARYVGSSMGLFWSVIFPIVNLFVFMFVFRILLNARWSADAGEKETALVMLTGILAWTAFAETVSRSTNSLVENSNLIQKVVFPSEVLPPYLAISSLVNMMIGVPIVLLGMVLLTDRQNDYLPLLAVPVLLFVQTIFTLGLGYFFATLNLFLRDTFHVMGVGLTVWMFATPIFYPPEFVTNARVPRGADKEDGYYTFGFLLDINPMHWLIHSWRQVLCFGEWPQWEFVLRFGLVGVLLFALGSTFFLAHKRRFPDLL